jgi:hypothetical protein
MAHNSFMNDDPLNFMLNRHRGSISKANTSSLSTVTTCALTGSRFTFPFHLFLEDQALIVMPIRG